MPAMDCRKVLLRDKATGQPIRGVEDMVVDDRAGIAYLSAYDRWTVEGVGGAPPTPLPQGGIYVLPLDAGLATAHRADVTDVTASFKLSHDFHPHNIDLTMGADGQRMLYAVNRRYPRLATGAKHPGPAIEIFAVHESGDLAHRSTIESPLFCRANGVLGLGDGRFLVSNDGGACGGVRRKLELGLNLARSHVVLATPNGDDGTASVVPVADGIKFANGMTSDDQHVFLATTRGRAVMVYRRDQLTGNRRPVAPDRVIPVDGGPDNLSWSPGGHLIVATHPSLLKLARYRYRWLHSDVAPTQIIEVKVSDGSRRVLFRDDTGKRFSAATVAVVHNDMLIAGSVADEGIMVCRYPAEVLPTGVAPTTAETSPTKAGKPS